MRTRYCSKKMVSGCWRLMCMEVLPMPSKQNLRSKIMICHVPHMHGGSKDFVCGMPKNIPGQNKRIKPQVGSPVKLEMIESGCKQDWAVPPRRVFEETCQRQDVCWTSYFWTVRRAIRRLLSKSNQIFCMPVPA